MNDQNENFEIFKGQKCNSSQYFKNIGEFISFTKIFFIISFS